MIVGFHTLCTSVQRIFTIEACCSVKISPVLAQNHLYYTHILPYNIKQYVILHVCSEARSRVLKIEGYI